MEHRSHRPSRRRARGGLRGRQQPVHTQEWPNAEADFELTRLFSFHGTGWDTQLGRLAEYLTELVSTP